eukprot:jgi/Undpi1/4515/HiC_scaffold_18.g07869.m1
MLRSGCPPALATTDANVARRYELEIDTHYVQLNIHTEDIDYRNISVQAQIQATDAMMIGGQYVVGPVTSWLTSFVEWANNNTEYSVNVRTSGAYLVYSDPTTFYPALTNFTHDEDNVRFLADIVFNDDGEIEASAQISRSGMFLVGVTSTQKYIDTLLDVRDVVGQSNLQPQPIGFSYVFLFVEMFLVVYKELLLNFFLALVAVIVLSFLVLGKPVVVIIVSLTVAIIDVDLLGFVYHWGLEINGITVVGYVRLASSRGRVIPRQELRHTKC